jgi:hypothetical protein
MEGIGHPHMSIDGKLKLMIKVAWWEQWVNKRRHFKEKPDINLDWTVYLQYVKESTKLISLPPSKGFIEPPRVQIARHNNFQSS